MRENFNAGWSATLDGRRLSPIRLDGWQQGFVVPAGGAGIVELSYRANGDYRLDAVGGDMALALAVLALAPPRRRRAGLDAVLTPARAGRRCPPSPAPAPWWPSPWLGWPALPAFAVLALLARRRPALLSPLAGLAMLAAGIVGAVAVNPFPGEHMGAFGVYAEVLSEVALAAVLVSALGRPGRREEVRSS